MPVLKSGRAEKSPEVIDAVCIPARPPVRLRLATVRDCRRELARVYIEARSGELDPAIATRLCYLLTSLVGIVRDHELAARIDRLEKELSK